MSFLAQGDNLEFREGFGQYLLGAFSGKSSTTHLEKAPGLKAEELNDRWLAYVNALAGIQGLRRPSVRGPRRPRSLLECLGRVACRQPSYI